jgi:hypothetical protein
MQPRFLQEHRTWDVIVDSQGHVFGASAGHLPELKEKLKMLRELAVGTNTGFRIIKHRSMVVDKPRQGDRIVRGKMTRMLHTR